MNTSYDAVSEEKTYRAIGRFIYAFSQLESTIRDCVAESIGLKDEYYSDIVESYDIAMLCNIAVSVFEKSLERDQVEKLKPLINNFRDLNANRVRVAHGLWVPFMEGGTVHHTPRGRLKRKVSANQAESWKSWLMKHSTFAQRLNVRTRKSCEDTEIELTQGDQASLLGPLMGRRTPEAQTASPMGCLQA